MGSMPTAMFNPLWSLVRLTDPWNTVQAKELPTWANMTTAHARSKTGLPRWSGERRHRGEDGNWRIATSIPFLADFGLVNTGVTSPGRLRQPRRGILGKRVPTQTRRAAKRPATTRGPIGSSGAHQPQRLRLA